MCCILFREKCGLTHIRHSNGWMSDFDDRVNRILRTLIPPYSSYKNGTGLLVLSPRRLWRAFARDLRYSCDEKVVGRTSQYMALIAGP